MNKYKKKPLYLEIGNKVLEPYASETDMKELEPYKQEVKGKVFRTIMVQSNADIKAERAPSIWLYVEASGVTNKDLEIFGHDNFEDYVHQIADIYRNNNKSRIVDEMFRRMSHEQLILSGLILNEPICMLDIDITNALSFKIFTLLKPSAQCQKN